MLHNLDCDSRYNMYLEQRSPRILPAKGGWQRCRWKSRSTNKTYEWSGVVPAGPPTTGFLEAIVAGFRPCHPIAKNKDL